MAKLMKSINGVLFWDLSFFRGVHARERLCQVSWIPHMVLQ